MIYRKLLFILIFHFICISNTFSQNRFRLGISIGPTITRAHVKQDNSRGKVQAGFGTNIYFPAYFSVNDHWSLESGAGYILNKYTFSYDDVDVTLRTGSPYFPLKLQYNEMLKKQCQWFASLGGALQTAFARGTFSNLHTDTIHQVTTQLSTIVKPYALLNFETGIKKLTQKNKIHQLSLQIFYGLQTQTTGTAFHTPDPSSAFTIESKNHFVSLQYAFLFGKRVQP